MADSTRKSKDGKLEFNRETVLALSNGSHELGRHTDKEIADMFGITFLEAQKARKFTSFWENREEEKPAAKVAKSKRK